jgi:hypothetical protein
MPVAREHKSEWRRTLIDRAYANDIAAAKQIKDKDKVESLERDHQFELQLDDEEEDAELTRYLVRQSRRLHVPNPRYHNDDGTESDLWYEGPLTHRRLFTTKGVAYLRDEIRKERKARHELKAVWVPWLAALTGLVGAATGLVALVLKIGP